MGGQSGRGKGKGARTTSRRVARSRALLRRGKRDRPRGHPMLGATFARRFPSAVRSDRVAPAVKLKLPGDPPLRRYELPRALVVIHQHRQLPVGSIPSSPQFVPPGRLLGRRVHRWPLRATSSIAELTLWQKGLINDLSLRLGRVFHRSREAEVDCGKVRPTRQRRRCWRESLQRWRSPRGW